MTAHLVVATIVSGFLIGFVGALFDIPTVACVALTFVICLVWAVCA